MGYKIQNVLENAHKKVNEDFSEYINYLFGGIKLKSLFGKRGFLSYCFINKRQCNQSFLGKPLIDSGTIAC